LSQVGVWFTKDFGPVGSIFGGPIQFTGVSLLCLFSGMVFEFELRENDGKGQFVSYQFFPKLVLKSERPSFTCMFNYSSPILRVAIDVDGNRTILFDDRPRVRIRRSFLAVTGQNGKVGCPVLVNAIRLEGPQIRSDAKSPRAPEAVLGALEQRLASGAGCDCRSLLAHVERLTDYSRRVGESSDLDVIVRRLLVPVVGDWQRRSSAIVNDIARLRTSLDAGLNATVGQLALLKGDMQREFVAMKTEIHDIESDLYFGVLKNYQLQRNLSEATEIPQKEKTVRNLVILLIGEVSLALVFLVASLVHEMRKI
jgi:hypothetical protein